MKLVEYQDNMRVIVRCMPKRRLIRGRFVTRYTYKMGFTQGRCIDGKHILVQLDDEAYPRRAQVHNVKVLPQDGLIFHGGDT